VKLQYKTIPHSEQSLLLQEAEDGPTQQVLYASPYKKGVFLLPVSSFLDGLTSALPTLAASRSEELKAAQRQPQSRSSTELAFRCLTPD